MAHAYKKTLLAQLGFADADKQNPKHDLAVEYLALEHNAKRLVATAHSLSWDQPTVQPSVTHACRLVGDEPDEIRTESWLLTRMGSCEREKPLTKGDGRYRATVGFLDLVLRNEVRISAEIEYLTTSFRKEAYTQTQPDGLRRCATMIEVKAAPVGTGDLLRQVKLYREYQDEICEPGTLAVWVVAGCFKFTETQANALREERIIPVSLGALFDEWAERKRTDRTLATDIEEF